MGALQRLPIRSVWAARCALRCAPMAARSLRHLIGDATLAGVQTAPLPHIGLRAIAAQGDRGLPASRTPGCGSAACGALTCWASKTLGARPSPAPPHARDCHPIPLHRFAPPPAPPPPAGVCPAVALYVLAGPLPRHAPPCPAMFPPYGARAGVWRICKAEQRQLPAREQPLHPGKPRHSRHLHPRALPASSGVWSCTETPLLSDSAARRHSSSSARAVLSNRVRALASTRSARSGCAFSPCSSRRRQAVAWRWVSSGGNASMARDHSPLAAALALLRAASVSIRPSTPLALICCANWPR